MALWLTACEYPVPMDSRDRLITLYKAEVTSSHESPQQKQVAHQYWRNRWLHGTHHLKAKVL